MIAEIALPYPFDLAFMQRALIACIAVGAFAPTIGVFLVPKRLSLIGDGIGHVAFAGVGAGLLAAWAPLWTARTLMDHAGLCVARGAPGDAEHARELATRAHGLAVEFGLGGVEARADAMLGGV